MLYYAYTNQKKLGMVINNSPNKLKGKKKKKIRWDKEGYFLIVKG